MIKKECKDILQQLEDMSDEEFTQTLNEAPDYDLGELLCIYSNIPTIQELIQTGTGLELDNLADTCKFKSSRNKGEPDSSFRRRLWNEYFVGVWDNE